MTDFDAVDLFAGPGGLDLAAAVVASAVGTPAPRLGVAA